LLLNDAVFDFNEFILVFKKLYVIAILVILGKRALEVLLASEPLFVVCSGILFPIFVFLLEKLRLLLKLDVDNSLILQLLLHDLNLLFLLNELLLCFS
jgi:hypothetical protein